MRVVVLLLCACGKRPPDVVETPAPEPMARNVVAACPDTETKRYVGDTAICAAIRYVCGEGEQPFSDDCGCGCSAPPR